MKKSKLRNIIRESIRELINEQGGPFFNNSPFVTCYACVGGNITTTDSWTPDLINSTENPTVGTGGTATCGWTPDGQDWYLTQDQLEAVHPQCYENNNANQQLGCTDQSACNYDPNATMDDGTCDFTSCVDTGCTDNTTFHGCGIGCRGALNYNPNATVDDGSCEYTQPYCPQFNLSDWNGVVNWIPKWHDTTKPVFSPNNTNPNQPCNHICKKRQQWHDKCVQHFDGSKTMRIRHAAKAWYANTLASPYHYNCNCYNTGDVVY